MLRSVGRSEECSSARILRLRHVRVQAIVSTIALALIPRAVALNLAIGAIVAALKLPVYLDSVGTVLVAALAGPWAAILTGVTSNIVLGMLSSPVFIAFIPVTIVIGATAGLAARLGAFHTTHRAALAGAIIGLLAGATSVPIVLALFGGVTAGGTGLVTIALRALHLPLESAALIASISVDVLDKVLSCTIVAIVLTRLPRRIGARFRLPQAAA
jgi:energy-coupling factor transport system substrate-specific component